MKEREAQAASAVEAAQGPAHAGVIAERWPALLAAECPLEVTAVADVLVPALPALFPPLCAPAAAAGAAAGDRMGLPS